jgi:putative ABC transport system ATP-binding protein
MADRVVRFRDGRIVDVTVNAHKVAPREMSW